MTDIGTPVLLRPSRTAAYLFVIYRDAELTKEKQIKLANRMEMLYPPLTVICVSRVSLFRNVSVCEL